MVATRLARGVSDEPIKEPVWYQAQHAGDQGHLPRNDRVRRAAPDQRSDSLGCFIGIHQKRHRVRVVLGHGRGDVARRHGGNADPASAKFYPQTFEIGDCSGLGGAIGAPSRQAAVAGDAGNTGKRATPPLAHARDERLESSSDSKHVDIKHFAEYRQIIGVFSQGADADARVGDDDVRTAMADGKVAHGVDNDAASRSRADARRATKPSTAPCRA
jgi:hypothetical protein